MKLVWGLIILGSWSAAAESGWRKTQTPHFEIEYQLGHLPQGLTLNLERVHSRLRLDLANFAPWVSRQKIRLLVYSDPESYFAGIFKPPRWSNGISNFEFKAVAVPDQPTLKKLVEIIAHESAHLLFETYWRESASKPPSWLNEGLAMFEEAGSIDDPERSPWYRAMVDNADGAWLPLEDLATLNPVSDLSEQKDAAQVWYVQSYAMVNFLLTAHSRLQFKNFCANLRAGKTTQEALWLAYRYPTADKFEQAWKSWMSASERRRKLPAQIDSNDENPEPALSRLSGFPPLR